MKRLWLKGGAIFKGFDIPALSAAILIFLFGLVTMYSFSRSEVAVFFDRQVMWFAVGVATMFLMYVVDWRVLRKTNVIFYLYVISVLGLLALFVLGTISSGAQSWFRIGSFSIQPSDPAKIILILLLAKYFSKRHVEIKHIRHIAVSGIYALLMFVLVLLQPDFGSAIIIFLIWFSMVLVSGISKKHLLSVLGIGVLSFFLLWNFAFAPYQKARILSFIDPLADISGTGYNAFQSVVAIGSGGVVGKGVGYGTQSRLLFLPEFETDFIFAAFAEEWGLIGSVFVIGLFGVVIWRMVRIARVGESNFETFFALGLSALILSQFMVHVGMNIGLLPVTGTTLPFASYGGSHLVTEFAALGILFGMNRYSRAFYKNKARQELLGSS